MNIIFGKFVKKGGGSLGEERCGRREKKENRRRGEKLDYRACKEEELIGAGEKSGCSFILRDIGARKGISLSVNVMRKKSGRPIGKESSPGR